MSFVSEELSLKLSQIFVMPAGQIETFVISCAFQNIVNMTSSSLVDRFQWNSQCFSWRVQVCECYTVEAVHSDCVTSSRLNHFCTTFYSFVKSIQWPNKSIPIGIRFGRGHVTSSGHFTLHNIQLFRSWKEIKKDALWNVSLLS